MTEADFARDLECSVEQTKELRYNPTYFRKMMAAHGALATAQRLLTTPDVSEGFYTLARLQRIDLTLEAIVLKHAALFTAEEIMTAQQRLEEARTWSGS